MAGEGRGEEELSNAEIRVANDQPVVEIGQEITVKSNFGCLAVSGLQRAFSWACIDAIGTPSR